MDIGLRDRVYIVTGGSRGLGLAVASALVQEGARVLISGPHESTASAAAAQLAEQGAPGSATWVVADNADPAAPERLSAAALSQFGRLDGDGERRWDRPGDGHDDNRRCVAVRV